MNKVRLFLSSIVLTALALSTSLQAGISPLAFNGVFECFKKLEFAPNLGCAALQTGLVNNIRFCMVNPGKKDAHGNRLWIKDKASANDPVAALALLLFPSPTGTLSAMTSHPENIGRYLTVEHIAQLLNFCVHVRTIFLTYETSRKEIAEKIAFNKKNSNSKLVKAQDLLGGFQLGKNGLSCLNRLKKAAQSADDTINYKYFLEFEKTHLQEGGFLNKEQGRQLVSALCRCIQDEERHYRYNTHLDHFYPKYMPEQLLNAFFCLKFGQEDIPTLLQNLDDSIIDKNRSIDRRILDETDFENSNKKEACELTLDDIWILQNQNSLGQIIPFQANSHPIDYALASGYDQAQNRCITLEFADCMETVFRLFCNLMFYSKELSSFDLSLLKNQLEGSPRLKAFEDFFQLQTPDQANSGSRVIRNACNRIVGDLGFPIRYNQKSSLNKEHNDNEISGGIINFIRVLATAFNIECSPEPIYKNYQEFITEVTNWTTVFLQHVYSLFNPQKTVSVNVAKVSCFQTSINSEYDCGGEIKIRVDNDFEFTMNINAGHAQFDSINILQPVEHSINPNLSSAVVEKINSFFQGTVGESLLLLDSEIQKTITQPIYSLFQHDLRDSTQIIQVLEKLYSITNSSRISIEHAAPILRNCLQNFEWKNYRMMSRIQHTIKKWLKLAQKPTNELISQILQTEVQAIQYKFFKDHFDNVDDLLNYFHSASMVFLEGNVGNIFLPTQNHTSIKIIDFTDSEVEQVTISYDAFPNLEILDLSSTDNLQSFKLLGSLHKLKKISFESSSISKIKISGENCPNLEIIDVNDTNELEVFTLSNAFKKLNTIDLSNSAIPELAISGDNFPKLQNIDLSNTKSLKNLKLTGSFEWLKKLNLSFSEITQLKLADEYPNLEILDLRNTEQLESLELSGSFEKLNQILLSSSAITKLELEGKNFPALKNIELDWTNNLQRIELSSNFEQLTEIDVASSAVAKVIISGICPNLKTDGSKIIFVSS